MDPCHLVFLVFKAQLFTIAVLYNRTSKQNISRSVISVILFFFKHPLLFLYEGCSEIIETPAVNKVSKQLQMLFLVVMLQSISTCGIQVI